MSIFDWFNKKKVKQKKESNESEERVATTDTFKIPDYFEISEKDSKEYHFYSHSKAETSPKELEMDGEKINREINQYMQSQQGRILSSKLDELDIVAIHVKNIPNKDEYVDTVLDLKQKNNWVDLFVNTSRGIAIQMSLVKHEGMPLGMFFELFVTTFMNFRKIKYKKRKELEIEYKNSILRGEYETKNEEITFLSGIKKREVECVVDYIKDEKKEIDEQSRDYKLSLYSTLFKRDSEIINGIIVKNLKLNNSGTELIELDSLAREGIDEEKEDSFGNFAYELYNKYNKRITFVSKVNGTIMIIGIDKDEKCIYTTLPENKLTKELKELKDNSREQIADSSSDLSAEQSDKEK